MLMVRHTLAHKPAHPKKHKTALDYILYCFMVATPLFEIPQAVTIFRTQSAVNVSAATWIFFFCASLAWGTYAIRERQVPIMVTSSLYLVIEGWVVAGIIIYS